MNKKSLIGKLGEDIACEFLKNNKYKIIERNFRRPWGELDIITQNKNGVLVFVEVKTIAQSKEFENYDLAEYAPNSLWRAIRRFGNMAMLKKIQQKISWIESSQIQPEENLTASKLKKLQKTASAYANNHPELFNDKGGWRIDLIAIKYSGPAINELERDLTNDNNISLTELIKYCEIKHIKNI